MKVRRYEPGDAAAIERLNDRLHSGGSRNIVYPEGREQNRAGLITDRLLVAADDGEIRGCVWLKEQTFRVAGSDVVCAWMHYPVSESLVDNRFSGVGSALLMQCLREQPRLLALGLGGHDTTLARMLSALRWTGVTVPFFVRPLRPSRCLRELVPLRRTALRRRVGDAMALSGIGWLGMRAWDALRSARGAGTPRGYSFEEVAALGGWADDLWARDRDRYDFIGSRDAATVDGWLPAAAAPDIHRLRVRHQGADVGWIYVLRHDFRSGAPDRHFGRLTVGLIGDCFAAPEHAAGVMTCALDYLIATNTDIAMSNQLHPAWARSLRALGFFEPSSNFVFFRSPKASLPSVDFAGACHINRGDCDGPLWFVRPKTDS